LSAQTTLARGVLLRRPRFLYRQRAVRAWEPDAGRKGVRRRPSRHGDRRQAPRGRGRLAAGM